MYVCLKCGRKLKDEKSRDMGYGPICYRRMFGTSLRSVCKDSISASDNIAYYDISGQMTMEEYLQIDSK